jgi:hypothetical protein
LARLALQAADQAQVNRYCRELVAGIQASPGLEGLEEPLRVYLTVYDCLLALGDPAAPALLRQGRELLCQRAAHLTDPTLYQAFCEEIPAHRRLLALTGGPLTG